MRKGKILSIILVVILLVILVPFTILGINSNLIFSNFLKWSKQGEQLLTSQDFGDNELTQSEEIEDVGEIEQLILFEYSYTNFAAGFQHEGWFIDNQGNIRTFKVERDEDLWDWGNTKEDIEKNYKRTIKTGKKIDIKELNEKYKIMLAIKDGNYSEKVNEGADMGAYGCYCYIWNENKQGYDIITLSEKGDWSYYNLDSNARELDRWLKSLFN